jgi:mycofactocin glycosyltransferase
VSPAVAGLPPGFRIELDAEARWLDEVSLFAGATGRVLKFSPTGRRLVDVLCSSGVDSRPSGVLARRLTDAGAAHPVPPPLTQAPDVTVLIPVRDRGLALERCLAALGRSFPVVIVDDGSIDPAPIVALARRHNASLLRHEENRGPAAARNTGLSRIDTEFVALLDSDCEPDSDWIATLAAQLADPLVAAVAPRIQPVAVDTVAGRFAQANGPLDLGERAARVVPLGRVSYVPTAALLVRRSALADEPGPFDPALRYGEDVDLVWRLHAAGWQVRYEPAVTVAHHEPDSASALLVRRYRYGTSAGPLASRHPANLAPLILAPFPAAAVFAVLARRPLAALTSAAAAVVLVRRSLQRIDVPARGLAPAMARTFAQTALGIARYSVQFASPVLFAAALPGGRRAAGRRAMIAALFVAPALENWRRRRPKLDPARYVALHIADEIAYGAGVWRGSLRARTSLALRPTFSKI